MRSVRCDVCGNKALMAASQCPKCGHLFEVRDGFGQELPLSYCSSCVSFYPTHVGSCKWCGTKPERPPRGPLPWKHIGIGALVAAVWVAWMMHDPRPKTLVRPRAVAQSTQAPVDTAPAVTLARDTVEPVAAPTPVVEAPAPTAAAGIVAQAPPPSTPEAGSIEKTPPSAPAAEMPKPTAASRWVSLIARSWVVVRADARASAHIVASIGPDSRVQLGESSGSWRRIRSRDIAGWVDVRRATFAPVRRSLRANGLASR